MFRNSIQNFIFKFTLLCVFAFYGIECVTAEPLFKFQNLTKKNGLASTAVLDIVQDKNGFMWFATEDGLQKYDGMELVTYRYNRKNEKSLSNNLIRVLLVDKSGSLWIGTNNGLNLYNKEEDNFVRYSDDSPNERRINSNQIRSIYQSTDGLIWVGTSEGLNTINPKNGKIESFPHAKVRAIFEDSYKQIWVGTLYEGLSLFDRASKKFIPIELSPEDQLPDAKSPLDYSVISIYKDNFGRILVATWGNGVYALKRDARKLVKLPIDLPSQRVRTIYQDKKGYIWFGTSHGIAVVEPPENSSKFIRAFDRNESSLIVDNIYKIYQSTDDTIWIGTYGGGVSRHFPNSRDFESYGLHSNEDEGLIDPVVYTISENEDGEIWIGTESGKLALFDPVSKTFKHFELVVEGVENKYAINTIYQIDSRYVFIGTATNFLKFDVLSKKTEKVTLKDNLFFSTGLPVRIIFKDSNNLIWVGVDNEGIQAFKFYNSNLIPLKNLKFNISSPIAILEKNDGSILVADKHLGAFEIADPNGNDKSNINIVKVENTSGLNILDVREDWNGRLWISTPSSGIKILTKGSKAIELDESNGLPNNFVYTVIPDSKSRKVWASTNAGLASIDVDTLNISVFDASDGLQGDEFNKPGILSKRGYLYFGGINGFNRFYPNIIQKKLFLVEPEITEISVANKIIKFQESTKKNTDDIVNEKIEFNYVQTPFAFHFTSPQYVKPAALEFRYRLQGLSETWFSESSNIRRATYTNLDPGEYEFELMVRAANAEWKELPRHVKISIIPPWWNTQLARSLYGIAILSIGFLFSYLMYKKRKKETLVQNTLKESEERLKLSLWGSGYEFWDWNIETGVVSRSNEFRKIDIDCPKLSRNLNELATYVHPEDLDLVKEKLVSHITGGTKHFDISYRVKDKAKAWCWIQDRGKVVAYDSSGNALRMSGTQRDITEIREKEAQFEMLGQAFKSTSDGVWIRDNEWRLVECNPAYERMTGFSLGEKRGEVLWFPDIREQSENLIQRIRISIEERGNWQGEAWAERKNNDPFPQKLSIDTLHDEKGNVRYYVGVFSDITFHKRTEEEFRKLANYDSLTGLPNRACLYDRLNQTIEKTKRDKGRFALFLVDVDNFKRINDSLGHNVGDHLIRQVASRLVNCNKEGDTVARIGGDEFVVIVENIKSSTTVATFSQILLKELNQPIFVKGQKLKLNFSIGITLAPDDALVAERLMRNADTAMYEAKKTIENSYQFYSVEFNERARKRLALENALRKAIEDETIELFYQPKVDLKTGMVEGVEALARWTHKELGFISPAEFIPLAEDTGLIIPLGHQILRMAIRQTKTWVDMGIMRGRTSINLSAHQFWNRNLAEETSQILNEEGLEAKYIELEITESACMQDIEETKLQIKVLKSLGFSLALDDFGTGYSSLAQLKSLPFDTLKVDKSFVDNIETNGQDAKVVKAIIDIAKTMEMEVVIEGVESKSQCEYLWMNRAFLIQGYFFSRPLRASFLPEMFARRWHKQEYLSMQVHNVTPLG